MAVIVLQPPRIISLSPGASTSEFQAESMAALVDSYRLVTPFVRLIRSADNSMEGTDGVNFSFLTAAVLLDPNESNESGTRFVDVTATTNINVKIAGGISSPGSIINGKTFTYVSSGSKMTAIENPGALLIWKATNVSTSTTNTFKFEIHLVCRP